MDGEHDATVRLLRPGATLGPYTVEELLGIGGSTLVYRALDNRLGRRVALKVLAGETLTPSLQRRFIEEARAAASLNHPNIAVIYDVGEAGRDCYIAMEYVDGETLRRRLRSPDATLPELLGYLRQAAKAMAKAHAGGVVHCDLKPDNIMVTREGLVKVLDFGLARLIARYRSATAGSGEPARETVRPMEPREVEGTLGYMSPEQAEGVRDLDQRSDVFSFGCILFEAAARRLPFAGESEAEVLDNLRHKPAPSLAAASPAAPEGLCRIVDRCLEKDPALRCSSMEEVERALGNVLEGGAEPASRVLTRRKWLLAAGGASLAAVAGALEYRRRRPASATPSVAVIPFVNARGSPENAYLSDGISEGLINALAKIPSLKVIARSSSFRFRGERIDVRQAARALGVRTLVTGSVAEMGGRLRIAVDLVGADGTQMWGMQYNRAVSELAGLEAGVSSEIAERIGSKLTEIERARLARSAKVNPEAYEALLRARYHLRLYTPESRKQAAGYYEQALAIDPGFALAHAELANLYRLLGGSGVLSASETMPKAEAEARRALAADQDLAEAHAALADIRKDQWDWSAAEKGYQRALELNPNLVAAHQGYAIFLGVTARHAAAIGEIHRALQLDPLGLPTAVHAAAVYYNARRFPEALEALDRAVKLDPAAPSAWSWIGIVNGGTGRYAEAVAAYEKAVALGDDSAATGCYFAFSLARAGRRDDALRLLERLRKTGGFVPPSALAVVQLGLNRRDEALRALQAAYAARDPLLQYLNVESHFDDLANDPAFRRLTATIGLPR